MTGRGSGWWADGGNVPKHSIVGPRWSERPEWAYWVGFLMADGCVTRGPGEHRVWAVQKDKDHLNALREFVGAGSVRPRRDGTHVYCITDSGLAGELMACGVVPAKSLTARVNGLEMDRDFWRGVVDGDGCINSRKDGYRQFQVVGSAALMGQFRAFLDLHVPQCRAAVTRRTPHMWGFTTAGSTAAQIIHLLYDGATVALPRKAARALCA